MWTEYPKVSGTVIGETMNEVYNRYGQVAAETAHYGWTHVRVEPLLIKIYNLVDVTPCQFLVATVRYYADLSKPAITEEGVMAPAFPSEFPQSIHLEWVVSNTPFLTKDELDINKIPYNL